MYADFLSIRWKILIPNHINITVNSKTAKPNLCSLCFLCVLECTDKTGMGKQEQLGEGEVAPTSLYTTSSKVAITSLTTPSPTPTDKAEHSRRFYYRLKQFTSWLENIKPQ